MYKLLFLFSQSIIFCRKNIFFRYKKLIGALLIIAYSVFVLQNTLFPLSTDFFWKYIFITCKKQGLGSFLPWQQMCCWECDFLSKINCSKENKQKIALILISTTITEKKIWQQSKTGNHQSDESDLPPFAYPDSHPKWRIATHPSSNVTNV